MKTPKETQALLLIADISGFTHFMRLHALAGSHSRQIIARLLEALIDAARPPLTVAELEGDAVFFYAPANDGDLRRTAADVKPQVLRFMRVFKREIEALSAVRACICEACVNVDRLRLKQVIHGGEISVTQIGRFKKLLGLDVIVVHRMLKNTVPSGEYVMMTEPAFASCNDFYALEPEHRIENLDGIGELPMLVFYEAALAAASIDLDVPEPTRAATFAWKARMHARTLVELISGRRQEIASPIISPV